MALGLRSRIFRSRLYDLSLGARRTPLQFQPPALSQIAAPDPAEVAAWLTAYPRWHAEAWRNDRIGQRLNLWLTHHQQAAASSEEASRLLHSLHRQVSHVYRNRHQRPEAAGCPLEIYRGLIAAALAFANHRKKLPYLLHEIEGHIAENILPDGGHRDRNPERHLLALRTLIHIRQILLAARLELPQALQPAIDRMAPRLAALTLGDGGLTQFNGGHALHADQVSATMNLSESRAQPASSAPHTGLHRLAAQRTRLVIDAGVPQPGPATAGTPPPHAGSLALEMSVGKHRLIVNCGAVAQEQGNSAELADALRATAAHSTLTFANTNSSDLVAHGLGARRVRQVETRRREQDRNLLLESSHDGYAEPFGVKIYRSLYLAQDGLDLRGEDVVAAETSSGRPFHIRFHLHPDIQASVAEGGKKALIRLPTGRGWTLSISDGELSLEESIYSPNGKPQRTTQLVISARHARRTETVKWRLSRAG